MIKLHLSLVCYRRGRREWVEPAPGQEAGDGGSGESAGAGVRPGEGEVETVGAA